MDGISESQPPDKKVDKRSNLANANPATTSNKNIRMEETSSKWDKHATVGAKGTTTISAEYSDGSKATVM